MLPSLLHTDLQNGDRMTREEFLRRWEQLPDLKNAELIDGVVYLASPVSFRHASYESLFTGWLHHYNYKLGDVLTIVSNATLLLGGSSFQPDVALRRGRTRLAGKGQYLEGPPDLVVEISYSSRAYDLGPKLAAYRSGGVREYVSILLEEQRVEWRVLSGSRYRLLEAGEDLILRSPHFQGLWLDTGAVFPPDSKRLFEAIEVGLLSGRK